MNPLLEKVEQKCSEGATESVATESVATQRMEPLLFADIRHAFRENAPEWAFHMRSGKRSKKEKRYKTYYYKMIYLFYFRKII